MAKRCATEAKSTRKERNVLITGASSGIGAAIAECLADQGFRVWGTTRSLAKVADLPKSFSEKVSFIELDVTDEQSVAKGVADCLKQAGKIDILINNAGYGVFGSVEEFPVEKAVTLFETNYFGALRMIQAVLPQMRASGEGLIINITSLAGKFVIPFQVHYSASKYALEALTEGLRQELRPFGVKVVAVAPGDIKTNFNKMTDFGCRADSPYQRWADVCWRVIEENLEKSPPPEVIARKVWQIVRKKNPRGSHPAGDFISTKLPFINRFLPASLREKLTRMFYGIN
ncbi:MAG TPA: SDR family NAD(P)-dependent oxidoreductase [Firmicutes bacterium]|nr:SDR family NAD(P)-dependent oxidoreductase [Bacillota bacterium]